MLIQLKNLNQLTPERKLIVENIDYLGKGDLKALQKITNLKEDGIRENIKFIRELNPKPGTKYSEDDNNIFHPDVIVTKKEEIGKLN